MYHKFVVYSTQNAKNMSGGNGKVRVTRNIAASPEEVEALRELDRRGCRMYSQTVPSELPVPFMPQLEAALQKAE